MSKFNRNKLKYLVDEHFFDKWTSQMAYILGFTFADGNIYKTSLAWDLQLRDKDLLIKINKALDSTYPIRDRDKSVRLRINNQKLINGAIKKGLIPKKSLRLVFPRVPREVVKHFIRGYFDGDGWLTHRVGRNESDLGFVCGNKSFLIDLSEKVECNLKISGKIRTKNRITSKGSKSTTYLLEYFSSNAILIADWLYKNMGKNDICLERKYQKYLESKEIYNLIWKKFKSKMLIQRKFGASIKEILSELFNKRKLNGMQISKYLGTSKSSVYRWLESTGVKYLS